MFTRDPRTKEELLDRILRYDFTGDIRNIGAETARLERVGPNELELIFPRSNVRYTLTVHRPRGERELSGVSSRSFASREAPPPPPEPAADSAPAGRRAPRRKEREERWET